MEINPFVFGQRFMIQDLKLPIRFGMTFINPLSLGKWQESKVEKGNVFQAQSGRRIDVIDGFQKFLQLFLFYPAFTRVTLVGMIFGPDS